MKSTYNTLVKYTGLFMMLFVLTATIAHANPNEEPKEDDDNEEVLVCILFPQCEGPQT
ncbi:hypothetical protein OAP14_11590 [Aliiglaciecola sp.]|nr:hypothetical protein [Aliiglaciecola sp.]